MGGLNLLLLLQRGETVKNREYGPRGFHEEGTDSRSLAKYNLNKNEGEVKGCSHLNQYERYVSVEPLKNIYFINPSWHLIDSSGLFSS